MIKLIYTILLTTIFATGCFSPLSFKAETPMAVKDITLDIANRSADIFDYTYKSMSSSYYDKNINIDKVDGTITIRYDHFSTDEISEVISQYKIYCDSRGGNFEGVPMKRFISRGNEYIPYNNSSSLSCYTPKGDMIFLSEPTKDEQPIILMTKLLPPKPVKVKQVAIKEPKKQVAKSPNKQATKEPAKKKIKEPVKPKAKAKTKAVTVVEKKSDNKKSAEPTIVIESVDMSPSFGFIGRYEDNSVSLAVANGNKSPSVLTFIVTNTSKKPIVTNEDELVGGVTVSDGSIYYTLRGDSPQIKGVGCDAANGKVLMNPHSVCTITFKGVKYPGLDTANIKDGVLSSSVGKFKISSITVKEFNEGKY